MKLSPILVPRTRSKGFTKLYTAYTYNFIKFGTNIPFCNNFNKFVGQNNLIIPTPVVGGGVGGHKSLVLEAPRSNF